MKHDPRTCRLCVRLRAWLRHPAYRETPMPVLPRQMAPAVPGRENGGDR